MTDTLRTAIVYLAYLSDPQAYPQGSMLPHWIVATVVAQCVLAALLLVPPVRASRVFAVLVLAGAAAVPVALWSAGARNASILTSMPLWIFCVVQLCVALVWIGRRHQRRLSAHVTLLVLFLLFTVPCASVFVAGHLVDPAYRTY
jgi:hypothetical protein